MTALHNLAASLARLCRAFDEKERLDTLYLRAENLALNAKLEAGERVLRTCQRVFPAETAAHRHAAAAAKHTVAGDPDGWSWPIQVIAAGKGFGSNAPVDGAAALDLPHYFPESILPQFAEAANGVRLRRRHPGDDNDGNDAPELTCGWISDAVVAGDAVVATANLLKGETGIRERLLAAREAGKLDLFGVSIFAYVAYSRSNVDGAPAFVAKRLVKLVGVDMCAEPGAAGWFLA